MATYIVDTSVVMERLIRGQYTDNARRFFDEAKGNHALVVPEFCLIECTNVLWKHVRFHSMPREQAAVLLRNLRGLTLKRAAVKSLLAPALEIGLSSQLAIYDSIYIALARKSTAPLISIDVKQQNVAAALGVALKPITDFV